MDEDKVKPRCEHIFLGNSVPGDLVDWSYEGRFLIVALSYVPSTGYYTLLVLDHSEKLQRFVLSYRGWEFTKLA